MDTTKEFTHIGLCAGYGGIELGLHRVIRNLRSIALCEIEAFACANLVSKMEAGLMDPAPIWTDLKTFPWAEFRDRVDILTSGYPCQPFSAAGKRAGKEDPRHLWPFIADGIRILRPRLCFFENVEGHISLGLREVIGELEQIGYQTAWGIFSAREVGAPHQRKRVFILAYRICDGYDWRELQDRVERWSSSQLPQPHAGESSSVWSETIGCGQAWPSRPGEPQHGWEPPRVVGAVPKKLADFCTRDAQQGGDTAQAGGEGTCERGQGQDAMPHGGSSLCGGDQGDEPQDGLGQPSDEGVGNAEGQRPAALRAEHEGLSGQLCAASAGGQETMGHTDSPRPQERQGQRGAGIQGTHADGGEDAERQTQPSVGRDPHGPADWMDYAELCITCDNRTDELRLLGNGVVPATAERAFRVLIEELLTMEGTN